MPPADKNVDRAGQHERYLAIKDQMQESARGAIDTGIMALKTVILLNGAATVAIIAFIGQLVTNGLENLALIAGFEVPLKLYTVGVFLGALATGGAYLRMFLEGYHHYAVVKRGAETSIWVPLANVAHYFAIAAVIAAYVMFIVATLNAFDAISALYGS